MRVRGKDRAELIRLIEERIRKCTKCELHKTKKNYVPGLINLESPLVFVGEAPGAKEDEEGLPFVGRAGKKLDALLYQVFGTERSKFSILNVLKCRPPNNADPTEEQKAKCREFLLAQLAVLSPAYICALGRHAGAFFFKRCKSLDEMRGKITLWNGIKVIATYHPAAVLRNPRLEEELKKDLIKLRKDMKEEGLLGKWQL